MQQLCKYLLMVGGGLVALLIAAVLVLTLTFDPNDYKPMIVKAVKDKKQRTLNIEGDLKLAFWPKLGVDLGRMTLSEPNRETVFVSLESAKVFIAVMPLLRRELKVDTVLIGGVKANIVRYPDGSTNFDDLLREEEAFQATQFHIDGIRISDAALTIRDEMGGRDIAIAGLELATGRIQKNRPIHLETEFALKTDKPAIAGRVELKGTLLADAGQQQYSVQGLVLAIKGDVARLKAIDMMLSGDISAKPVQREFTVDNLKLALKASQDGKAHTLDLVAPHLVITRDEVSGRQATVKLGRIQKDASFLGEVVFADFQGSPRTFHSSNISATLTGRQGERLLSGRFSSPVHGDLQTMVFDCAKLSGSLLIQDPVLPQGAAKVVFDANARTDIRNEQTKIGLRMAVDGARFTGNVLLAGIKRPHITFDLTADRLDFNKLLGPTRAKVPSATTARSADRPADLSVLQNVMAEGRLSVDEILYDKHRITNLAMRLKADGQALTVSQLSARINESRLRGSVGIRNFAQALYVFDLDIDRIDLGRYLPQSSTAAKAPLDKSSAPLHFSYLKALNAQGVLRIGSLIYGDIQSSNIRLNLKADGKKFAGSPFANMADNKVNGEKTQDVASALLNAAGKASQQLAQPNPAKQ